MSFNCIVVSYANKTDPKRQALFNANAHSHVHQVPPLIRRMLDKSAAASGVKLFLHPRHTPPPLTRPDRHRPIQPGTRAILYVNSRGIERLGAPWGQCLDVYPYNPHPSGPYVQETCYELCMYRHIAAACGCRFEHYSHLELVNDTAQHLPHCFYPAEVLDTGEAEVKVKDIYHATMKYRFCTLTTETNRTVKVGLV